MLDQDTAWTVYQNTVVPVDMKAALTEGQVLTDWINFGGKNGIPILETAGLTVFAFNAGNGALVTGSSISGIAQIQGVWLRD